MKKLTTFQIVLLAVFGSLGVGGVMIFALLSANANVSTIGPVVIWGTFDDTQIRTMLRDAADNDPRYSEVQYVQKDPVTYDAEIKDALASGKGPDLFIMRQDHAIRDQSYSIHVPYSQLSEAQFRSTFLDAAEPFLAKDGVIAIPIVVDPLVLFWNKDALASANIAAPPKYWDQLPAMVASLVKKNDSGAVERGGIALGSYDNIGSAKDILATMMLQIGAKIMAYDNAGALRPALASQGSAANGVTALTYYTEFADPSLPDYTWSKAFKSARAAFAAGDVAMYIGHASEYRSISVANPNLNFEMAPVPQIQSSEYALDTSHVYAFALARTTKNARGALTIASLLATEDKVVPIAKSLGMVTALRRVLSPAKKSASSDQTVAAQQDALQGLIANAPQTSDALLNFEANISKAWPDPDPDKTNQIFRDMIESTVSGERKASEALQRADKQLGEISL